MFSTVRIGLREELDGIRERGTFKDERPLDSAQSAHIRVGTTDLLNFCANNYLGLADNPEVLAAAKVALDDWGFGMASVRFICGTQAPHHELERRLSTFLGFDDTVLFSSCFDANGGVFETLLGVEDTVISDELNHASIIDGIRLSRAQRLRYPNRDTAALEKCLQESRSSRRRLIVTDGVFSMDGHLAPLVEICDLADRYDALVMVDDSHAVGFMGEYGRGTHELLGVEGRIDILTGTLGKALGGASGGYVSAHTEIVELLRQRSRPYLFSNSLAPAIVGASLRVLDLVAEADEPRRRLMDNTATFRTEMTAAGFDVVPGEHPIVPIMLGDAVVAARMAEELLGRGIFVTAFSYPVVPHGSARIRVQLSAMHSAADIATAVKAFVDSRATLAASPSVD